MEGCGRDSDAAFAHFLEIASGSAKEVEYQLTLARDLGYVAGDDYQALFAQAEEIGKMLGALRRSVRKRLGRVRGKQGAPEDVEGVER